MRAVAFCVLLVLALLAVEIGGLGHLLLQGVGPLSILTLPPRFPGI